MGVGGVRERTDEAFKDEADLEALFKFGTEQMEELRDFVLMSGNNDLPLTSCRATRPSVPRQIDSTATHKSGRQLFSILI